MESVAVCVYRFSFVCWFYVVGDEHDGSLLLLCLGFLFFWAGGAAVVAALLGFVCGIATLEGFGGMAEFSVLDGGHFDNAIISAGSRIL